MSWRDISEELRTEVIARDNNRCRYCLLSQEGQAGRFHIDHVYPSKEGGRTESANLVMACPWCNLHKGTKLHGIDPPTGNRVALFHPLIQNWQEHFLLRADGTCHGVTPAGRATVLALKMNDEFAIRARQLQMNLGIMSPTEHERN